MSTAVAISTIAAVSAADAQESANRAEIASCHTYMIDFQGRTATVEQSQQYANCTNLIYPEHNFFSQGIAILLLMFIIFGVILGGFSVKRNIDGDTVLSFIGSLLFSGTAFLCVWGLWELLYYIFH